MADARVRTATALELDAIVGLDASVFGTELGQTPYPGAALRRFLDLFPELMIVAPGIDGVPIGYASGGIGTNHAKAWLLNLAVTPTHRRHGVGRALSWELIARVAKMGATSCGLTVDPSNGGAIGLYEDLGFAVVKEEADYFGAGKSRLLMEASLTAPSWGNNRGA